MKLIFSQSILCLLGTLQFFGRICYAQLPMPANYLPKEYFLEDGSRDPRHIQHQPSSSGPNSYFGIPSPPPSNNPGDPHTTTTYHLNPQLPHHHNVDNSQGSDQQLISNRNFFLSLNNNNPENNQFGAKILKSPRISDVEGGSSVTINGKRQRRRLTKIRRVPKAFRPPKEYIIYSLPEQSFWASPEAHNPEGLRGSETGDNDDDAVDAGGKDGNDLDDDSEEEDDGQSSKKNDEGDGGNKEGKNLTAESKIGEESKPILSQKKTLLGQCMKHCIDALL